MAQTENKISKETAEAFAKSLEELGHAITALADALEKEVKAPIGMQKEMKMARRKKLTIKFFDENMKGESHV